jgi:hypothetical protein
MLKSLLMPGTSQNILSSITITYLTSLVQEPRPIYKSRLKSALYNEDFPTEVLPTKQ